jgi:pyruvate,water dikinase
MIAVELAEARDESAFGGKAVQLGAAVRAGLPVPAGFALTVDLVETVARGRPASLAKLAAVWARLTGPLAVRSSGAGEDSATASFAGQHATVLGVRGLPAVTEAVEAVWRSASSEAALGYRRRMGVSPEVRIGVVIQEMVAADVAGVLFTRNPVTGADEIVVEATWGLGEAIVQGLVIPDRYRIARHGEVLEQTSGFKQLAVRQHPDGQTHQEPVSRELAEKPCLDAAQLRSLHQLAARCDDVYGAGPHDVEWAFRAHTLHLLQWRPITTSLIWRELHKHPEFSEGELAITHRRNPARSGRRLHGGAPGRPGCQEFYGCSEGH